MEEDDDQQWQWRSEEVLRLQNPDTQEKLLTGETVREDFDITGL